MGDNQRMGRSNPESQVTENEWRQLAAAAAEARTHAYAPYSKFSVGAAVLTRDRQTFSGCNVENASYGLTICAERSAIFAAVRALSVPKIVAVYIETPPDVFAPPCGACLQVMDEFGDGAEVSFVGESGRTTTGLRDLLPVGFRLS